MPEPVTKLDLVKRLAREAGEHASGPTSTLLQRGNNLKLVDDIDTAYSEIQTYQTTWRFHRKSFSKVLTIDKADYTAAELDITDLRNWDPKKVNLFKLLNDEAPLTHIPLDIWESTYGMGSSTIETGRASSFTIQADNSITLFPIPNYEFTLRGKYRSRPHQMVDDLDEPIFALYTGWQLSGRLWKTSG